MKGILNIILFLGLFTVIKAQTLVRYVEMKNNSDKNIYVQSYTLNGKKLTMPFIDLKEVQKGGTLVVEMIP